MYKWYEDAAICYVYLQDIEILSSRDIGDQLSTSRWFTRGWTLQELIAPSVVVFYDTHWNEIGPRSSLIAEISKATGIDSELFVETHLSVPDQFHNRLSQYTIAQKMSWASRRETTRIEDQAYCLLGLFGVHMPLLYGEGRISFIRLQEEIMKRSSDLSIFAWNPNRHPGDEQLGRRMGFLADSPTCFADSANVVQASVDYDLPPYGITNQGIQITLPIVETDPVLLGEPAVHNTLGPGPVITIFRPGDEVIIPKEIAVLNCTYSGFEDSLITLTLQRDEPPQARTGGSSSHYRVGRLESFSASRMAVRSVPRTIYLQPTGRLLGISQKTPLVLIRQMHFEMETGFRLVQCFPSELAWSIHKSGTLSARVSREGKNYLFFENGACLIIEFDWEGLYTTIVANVLANDAKWEPVMWAEFFRNVLSGKLSGTNVLMAENGLKFVSATTKRHFGFLVELGVEFLSTFGAEALQARIVAHQSSMPGRDDTFSSGSS